MNRRIFTVLSFFMIPLVFVLPASGNVSVKDVPNDGGKALIVSWNPEDAGDAIGIEIYRSETAEGGEFVKVGELLPLNSFFTDKTVENGKPYYYKVVFRNSDESAREEISSEPGISSVQYFNMGRLNIFLGSLITSILVIYFLSMAKKGKELYIRPISGIEAVDEAIGRATEMGKPILYVSGLGGISDIATLAAISILGRVAKKAAEYDTPLLVPCRDPIVMTVQQEIVREAYMSAGRPDAYREENIFYITDSQFGYVAAVDGIMIREKPATNFYMGMFYAESLLLAETGAATGAIQISGTDMVTQIPFFITSCDYTLIGEELYAAGAYLSGEPLLLGSLKGQDWTKFLIVLLIVLGLIASTFGFKGFAEWFITQ